MTLVVSDNSPLNLLIRIEQVELLPKIFRRVIIPPEVANEMLHPKAPDAVRAFVDSPPTWLLIQAPSAQIALPDLDPGEAAAISLAAELNAALLIDEMDGRAEARARGLTVIGAIGLLESAANLGLIASLADVHARIRTLHFYVSDTILQASLARHLSHREQR
jgi:predicted nucleic acid-binding protein